MRRGQQCSLARSFQVLTLAMARSPMARILAWERSTSRTGSGRLRPGGRVGAEQAEGLADVAPGRGRADVEAGGQASGGVAVAQVRQDQQSLTARVKTAIAGTPADSVRPQQLGQARQAPWATGSWQDGSARDSSGDDMSFGRPRHLPGALSIFDD